MWIVGTFVLLVVGATLVVLIGWTPRAVPSPPLWDFSASDGGITGIVGSIAGFAVASAIFVASLDAARTSPVFATVIGLLLISFLILIVIALMYASIPTVPDGDGEMVTASLSSVLANMGGCLGLSISWLALAPLLDLIGLPTLADAFTWMLLTVAVLGSAWTALFAYRLMTASAAACLAIPVLGFGLPALYRLGAVRLWPALWPATDAALHFAFVAFAVATLMFVLHAGLLLTHGNATARQRLHRDGHRIALAYSAVSVQSVALTWFAVAIP